MTPEERIDRACFEFMTAVDFEPLRLWWEREALRSVLPPGPVDSNRLLMLQGDRERYLAIMMRAERHRRRLQEKEPE